MKIFNIIRNMVLKKEESSEFIEAVFPSELINEDIVEFSSGDIVDISSDGFIDTNDKLSIAKYKSNLKILSEQALCNGYVDKFKIIRDDDFFPMDYEWIVASKNTNIELNGSAFTYELRHTYAEKLANVSNDNAFGISVPSSKVDKVLSDMDKHIGRFYAPVKFRSTKHFTVNTPLGYTHDYNFVSANRLFTIIDDIGNFINSGYAYSLSYRDSYLDITHESLLISMNATILISKENYEIIKNDPVLMEQLNNRGSRKLIIFSGDESLAINMILSEQGVLPSKIEHNYLNYGSDLTKIIENSMVSLAQSKNIDYNISHAYFNGNGHFSDYYDSLNPDNQFIGIDLVEFLKRELPEIDIDERLLMDNDVARRFINQVGLESLFNIINKYNIYIEHDIVNRLKNYKEDRKSIDLETSNLFKLTLSLIKNYYKDNSQYDFENFDENKLKCMICSFFHSDSVLEQKTAALGICNLLYIENTNVNNEVNSNYLK